MNIRKCTGGVIYLDREERVAQIFKGISNRQ
jgi:hypothetical protein